MGGPPRPDLTGPTAIRGVSLSLLPTFKRSAKLRGTEHAQAAMGSPLVLLLHPAGDHDARLELFRSRWRQHSRGAAVRVWRDLRSAAPSSPSDPDLRSWIPGWPNNIGRQ